MKKVSIFLFSIFFMLLLNLKANAACLGEPLGKVLDLYGGAGVDSVVVIDNYAFVSLNYSSNFNNKGIRGIAKIDISHPENFKSYTDTYKDNNSYTLEQYLKDIADYVTIYKYGTEFASFVEDQTLALTAPLDSYIIKGEKYDDKYILFGYSQNYSDNDSFFWTYVVGSNTTKYMKITGYKVVNFKYAGKYLFILLIDAQDRTHYKVIAFPVAPLKDYFNADMSNGVKWTDFEIYDYTAKPSDSNSFFKVNFYVSYEGENDYEVDITLTEKNKTSVRIVDFKESDGLLEQMDFEDITVPLEFDKIIYASCNYIIVSDFEKLIFIKDYDNGTFSVISQIEVWDIYNTYIHDKILYIANMGAFISAVDIGDPYHPYIIDNGTIYGFTTNVLYHNGRVYGTHGWNGLAVYAADTCTSKATVDYYNNCNNDNQTTPEDNETGNGEDNGSTNKCDSGCFTIEDVNQISSTWYLAGTGCDITDMSIFNNVKTVWFWNNNSWMIYSNQQNIVKILQTYNIPSITQIPAKRGFWINK